MPPGRHTSCTLRTTFGHPLHRRAQSR